MENESRRLNRGDVNCGSDSQAVDQPDGFGTHEYVAPDEDPLQQKLARAHAIATTLNFELSE